MYDERISIAQPDLHQGAWKSVLALAVWFASLSLSLYLMMFGHGYAPAQDGRRWLPLLILMTGFALTAVIAMVVWRRFGSWTLPRLLLAILLPLSLTVLAQGFAVYANEAFDRTGKTYKLRVTDTFTLYRGDRAQPVIAWAVPHELVLNGRRLMFVSAADQARYPPGSFTEVTCHDGYLGMRWCVPADPRFRRYATWASDIVWNSKGGRITRVVGRFSEDSPYKREILRRRVSVVDLNEAAGEP